MATKRKYAYYVKGNKIALIQREDALAGSNNSEYGMYKSPTESIVDGLEIQYTYVPEYFIKETDKVDTQIDTYVSTCGLLKLIDQGDNNYSASPESLSDGSYIVLTNAGKFNGLHKIASLGNNGGTNNKIILETSYNGSEAAWTDFEETVNLYYVIDVLNDESDEIDLSSYLSKALVYYVKGRLAEDAGQMDMREFFLKEFRKMVEKSESSKIYGSRMIMPGSNAIR